MARHFEVHGEITGLASPSVGAVTGNTRIVGTAFHNNGTAVPDNPRKRLVVENVEIRRCQHWACYAHGIVFQKIWVEDLRGGGRAPSYLRGCYLSEVTLKGWISGLVWKWAIDPGDARKSKDFMKDNLDRYANATWALDITEAEFSTFECFLGVPASKIRRNPEYHWVMTNSAAASFLEAHKEPSIWSLTAQEILGLGLSDTVVVVGGTGKKLHATRAEAQALAEKGYLT